MRTRLLFTLWIVILFLLPPPLTIAPIHMEIGASAQEDNPRFLITPYYGHASINSWFDHRTPTYDYTENYLVTYQGYERRNDDPASCNIGVNCYDGHNGIDFNKVYDPVLAAADGTVKKVQWDTDNIHKENHQHGYGLFIEIQHTVNNINYITRYGHLTTATVQVDEFVTAGTVIGTSGNTGGSSGAHLHFDIRIVITPVTDERVIDPFGWQPAPDATVTIDPWTQSMSGHSSWCMWIDGEWANLCPQTPAHPSRPIPAPTSGDITNQEIIVDDDGIGFSKGYGGLWNHPCLPGNCTGWTGAGAGIGNHSYYGLADGNTIVDQWARWDLQLQTSYSRIYEVYINIPAISDLDSNTFSWQAKYYIADATNPPIIYSATVDEYEGMGRGWLSIGTYFLIGNRSYVYTTDATGEDNNTHCKTGPSYWCLLTADAVRLIPRGTTYLPNVQSSTGGVTSKVLVRNNGGGSTPTKVSFLSRTGGICASIWESIPADAYRTYTTACSTVASVIVDSYFDISVVGMTSKSNGIDADNGIRPPYQGDQAFETTTTWLYAPAVFGNKYGWNSTVYLVNTGGSSANVTIYFKGRSNGSPPNPDAIQSYSIPSRYQRTPIDVSTVLNNWVGSLVIVSDQPLAGQIYERSIDGTRSATYNTASGGSTTLYAPALYKNQWGLGSAIVVQNLSTTFAATVDLDFYDRSGVKTGPTYTFIAIGTERAEGVNLSSIASLGTSWTGSVHITSRGGQPLAARVITDSLTHGSFSYNAATLPANYVYLPRAAKNANGRTTGYTFQNIDSESVDVTAYYYDDDTGALVYTKEWTASNNNQMAGYATIGQAQGGDPLADGWEGSIVLVASRPTIVAIMREDTSNSYGAFSGSVR